MNSSSRGSFKDFMSPSDPIFCLTFSTLAVHSDISDIRGVSFSSPQNLHSYSSSNEMALWEVVGISEVRKRGDFLETLKSGHFFYHTEEVNDSL